MQVINLTAAECRTLANEHRARANCPGISAKRVTLHSNIARSYAGLASQLQMLADDVAQDFPKGWILFHITRHDSRS
jgi:hypothetical protein